MIHFIHYGAMVVVIQNLKFILTCTVSEWKVSSKLQGLPGYPLSVYDHEARLFEVVQELNN